MKDLTLIPSANRRKRTGRVFFVLIAYKKQKHILF
jgi:hypothetical protein